MQYLSAIDGWAYKDRAIMVSANSLIAAATLTGLLMHLDRDAVASYEPTVSETLRRCHISTTHA